VAQFEPIQFAICKKVPVEADRLKCFDAIGPTAKTPEEEATDPAPVKGKWVYTATKSLGDGSDQVTAEFTSSSAAVTSNGPRLAKIEAAINQATLARAQPKKTRSIQIPSLPGAKRTARAMAVSLEPSTPRMS
jgi:hypothetical protein